MMMVIREINAREKYVMGAFDHELGLSNHNVYEDDLDALKAQAVGYAWREPQEDEVEDNSIILIGEPTEE